MSFVFLFYSILLIVSVPENPDERNKREKIEEALKNNNTTLEQWKEFATSNYGLVNGEH